MKVDRYTEEQIKIALSEWKCLLGLSNWVVNATFTDDEDNLTLVNGTVGICVVEVEYTRDIIDITIDKRLLKKSPAFVNYALCHELTHTFTSRAHEMVRNFIHRVDDEGNVSTEDSYVLMANELHNKLELATDQVARVFINLYGIVPALNVDNDI